MRFQKVVSLIPQFGGGQMPSTLTAPSSDDVTLQKIASLSDDAKAWLALTVNSAMTVLYWDIGKAIAEDLLKGEKPEYGDSSIASLAKSLRAKYGKVLTEQIYFGQSNFISNFRKGKKSFHCHDNYPGPTYWFFAYQRPARTRILRNALCERRMVRPRLEGKEEFHALRAHRHLEEAGRDHKERPPCGSGNRRDVPCHTCHFFKGKLSSCRHFFKGKNSYLATFFEGKSFILP